MAELSTLARPYAKAAFNAALETGDIAAWSSALATLGAIISTDDVHQFIGNPSVTASEKATTLANIAGDDCNEGAKSLLHVLAENSRFPLLEEISAQFD